MKATTIKCLAAFFIFFTCCKKSSTDTLSTTPVTLSATPDTSSYPAYTWQEHWFEHNQLLTRVFVDSNLVVYYDGDMNTGITWPYTFFSKAWQYTRQVYGAFGADNRLYAVFHANKYGGGHFSHYMEASHDYHNVIDCGTTDWSAAEGWNIGAPTHEIGHIVESAVKNKIGSPAWDIWRDSKWAEIFVYDVYKGIGETTKASTLRTELQTQVDQFPRSNTYWFRDWFLPIYEQYGGAAVLNRFFINVAASIPTTASGSFVEYTRRMNWGEFVHFFSGAAGTNLQPMAKTAFGWTSAWTQQLTNAKTAFPAITYTGITNAIQEADTDLTLTGVTLTVSQNNTDASENASKLIDNNYGTKLYLASFTAGFLATQQFAQAVIVNSYTLTSGNDEATRDARNWQLLGSNNGTSWTTLDTKTNQVFAERTQIRTFTITNTTAYKYYRLKVNATNGASSFQLSEWRLLKNL